ncbi:MAG: helix-turn-helix transcriptional regulator [Clostridia bacterium]|nr:helix-turn-helix transcriptional regulator [Clostridia bacterium]
MFAEGGISTYQSRPYCVEMTEEIAFYVKQLRIALPRIEAEGLEKMKALLTLILWSVGWFASAGTYNKGAYQITRNEYIFKINECIERSLVEKVTLSTVAKALFLSEKQVARILKKDFGCTLSGLIQEKKLSAAAILLRNTEKTVAEIAEELNFQTESYFFVLFKKKYGCTPLGYRKRKKE